MAGFVLFCFKSPLVISKHILIEMNGTFTAERIHLLPEVSWFGLVWFSVNRDGDLGV